jgi:hypothetical protein
MQGFAGVVYLSGYAGYVAGKKVYPVANAMRRAILTSFNAVILGINRGANNTGK